MSVTAATLVWRPSGHEIPQKRDISWPVSSTTKRTMTQAPARPHQDMLARITREITAGMAIKSAHLFRELQRYRDRLEVENAYLQEQIHEERGWEGIIGDNPALRAALRRVSCTRSSSDWHSTPGTSRCRCSCRTC